MSGGEPQEVLHCSLLSLSYLSCGRDHRVNYHKPDRRARKFWHAEHFPKELRNLEEIPEEESQDENNVTFEQCTFSPKLIEGTSCPQKL